MIFADCGAWHGYTCDDDHLTCVTMTDGLRHRFPGLPVVEHVEAGPDCMVARVVGGSSTVRIWFNDSRTAMIETDLHLTMPTGPLELTQVRPGLYHHTLTQGPATSERLDGLPATLRWNWRAPLGDITSGGCFPSPYNYLGFWAWDSWKHAAVLPKHLARQQVQAMFDHQRDDGMVPDIVAVDARRNNWRNSKPPLAAWACSQHDGLVDEFRPNLVRYHQWWERHRRPPGERLLAYGGDDLQASRWESGWDNSTRYDDASLVHGLQNVLSVDLNSYLCLEKRLLGQADPGLERLVNEVFFHDGAYYDVTWPDHEPVRTLTAATWIPLWSGIATQDRAKAVIRLMLDPDHFYTPLPFPTVARSDPKFDPSGYWRGSVWMDHAAWAVEALVRYGYTAKAREAAQRLLKADPDWENYNPITGSPTRGSHAACPQFSWTAAARVKLTSLLGQ